MAKATGRVPALMTARDLARRLKVKLARIQDPAWRKKAGLKPAEVKLAGLLRFDCEKVERLIRKDVK